MREEDLIKKLERTELPEVELPGHRQKLRSILFNQHSRQQRKAELFGFLWKTLPTSLAFMILLALVFNTSIFSRPDVALAKEIALRNSRFKSLIEKGAIISETQLSAGKGYILLSMREPAGATEAEKAAPLALETVGTPYSKAGTAGQSGFLVQVDFKTKKISDFKEFSLPGISFGPAEEQKIKEISEISELVKKEIPSQAVIKEIKAAVPQLIMVKKNGKIEVASKNEATIIYKDDGKTWEGKVNLDKFMVEKIEFLGERGK